MLHWYAPSGSERAHQVANNTDSESPRLIGDVSRVLARAGAALGSTAVSSWPSSRTRCSGSGSARIFRIALCASASPTVGPLGRSRADSRAENEAEGQNQQDIPRHRPKYDAAPAVEQAKETVEPVLSI
jgi:hypothetical protein